MIGIAEFFVMMAGIGPALLFWIAVIVFAAVMLRRGGGRAERFVIAGAGIKIIGNLLTLPAGFMPIWLRAGGYSPDAADALASGCGIFVNVVGMAGIICLVYAFWVKFKEKNIAAAPEAAA